MPSPFDDYKPPLPSGKTAYRKEFELSDEDMKAILEAIKPSPIILLGTMQPATQQERANRAWELVGEKMGFFHMTVKPHPTKGPYFFTAIPKDSPSPPPLSGEMQAPETLQ